MEYASDYTYYYNMTVSYNYDKPVWTTKCLNNLLGVHTFSLSKKCLNITGIYNIRFKCVAVL